MRTGIFRVVEKVGVMNIDVEGLEPHLFMGGNRFYQATERQDLFVQLVYD